MKYIIILLISFLTIDISFAQSNSMQYISHLEIKKKERQVMSMGDSSITIIIDTLLMNDKAHLEFYGKKNVILTVKHAVIPKTAYISGTDGKNNAADMRITMRFKELGALYILAGGRDANNGSRTFPNGNGGDVIFNFLGDGIIPQQKNKKASHYLEIDTRAGGYSVDARSDLYNIYSRIGTGARSLGQLSQGQVYSGSPGVDGKVDIKEVNGFKY